MSKIWSFIKRDARRLHLNVISLVVIVGIIVVPTFYAWFNIAGSWDPYGNTNNLKVAVANCDAGYSSDLMPVEINFGDRVEAELRESTSIGYTFTSEEDALEGVRSGQYYAAVVIPEDFSTEMMTVLTPNPTRPQVTFYQNDKANAIAQIVTNKASSAIQADINKSFASSITTVGAGVLEELGNYLDDDNLADVAAKLDGAVSSSTSALTDTATNLRDFSGVIGSTQGMLGSSSSTLGTSLSSTLDLSGSLSSAANDVRGLGSALDGATDSLSDAISSSASSLDSVSGAVDQAFSTADGQIDKLTSALGSAAGVADDSASRLDALSSKLGDAANTASNAIEDIDEQLANMAETDPRYAVLAKARAAAVSARDKASEGQAQASAAAGQMRTLSSQLNKTAGDVASGKQTAADAKEKLSGVITSAKSGITTVQGVYESDLRGSLGTLADQIDGAAGNAQTITDSLSKTLGDVSSMAASAADGLGDAASAINEAADALDTAASRLSELHAKLSAALDSQDMQQVRDILTANPDDLASFISSPVAVDRNAVFAIENNGSAMAPFYTTLAIWIGGVVLAALVKTNASEKALEETGCSHTQAYIARLALFALIGLLQSTLICAGDLYYLGVQCANPVLFFLAGWLASFTFVNIIYALTASFGDVGKAIAVVLMVIQVAGSGGTFPREMLPQAFQAIYPFLPFVHAENAMRAAMFGLYGNDFWVSLGTLAGFIVPALLLGLVLRKPIIRLNEWVETKLESTKLM